MPIGAIIAGGGALLGGLFQGNAIRGAADASAGAANNALALQQQEYQDISGKLQPYRDLGNTGLNTLASYFGLLPGETPSQGGFLSPISSVVGQAPNPNQFPTLGGSSLTAAPNPNDPAVRINYAASPGYQFALDQSIDAITNSSSAKGGLISGNMYDALQKNAAGFASQDFNNYYNQLVNGWQNNNNNYWNNYNAQVQGYNQNYSDVANQRAQIIAALSGFAGGGQSAATNTGNFGAAAATGAGNAMIAAAGAQGAGQIGAANTFANTLTNPNVTNALTNGANALTNGAGFLVPNLYSSNYGYGSPSYGAGGLY